MVAQDSSQLITSSTRVYVNVLIFFEINKTAFKHVVRVLHILRIFGT
jgi:hypothetical protein